MVRAAADVHLHRAGLGQNTEHGIFNKVRVYLSSLYISVGDHFPNDMCASFPGRALNPPSLQILRLTG